MNKARNQNEYMNDETKVVTEDAIVLGEAREQINICELRCVMVSLKSYT